MRMLKTAMLVLWAGVGYANPETTVDLPGGATMEMVWIEPGTFMMGSPDSDPDALADIFADEKPQHQVTLTKGFYLGKYEITQAQWEAVMGMAPWSGDRYAQANPSNPAVDISWDDLQAFIQKLNNAAGEMVYRLPTEAEWEYACRAGTTTRWSFGDEERQLKEYAWYEANAWNAGLQYAQPVGKLLPNQWGLFDMHGNVWEWCQDWYGGAYYTSTSQTDPAGPTSGSVRVGRGGIFDGIARGSWSAFRYSLSPDFRGGNFGARLLRMGPAPTSVTPQSWGEVKGESR